MPDETTLASGFRTGEIRENRNIAHKHTATYDILYRSGGDGIVDGHSAIISSNDGSWGALSSLINSSQIADGGGTPRSGASARGNILSSKIYMHVGTYNA